MKFKELELKQEGSWLKRFVKSKHNQKSAIYTLLGMVGGVLYFYFSQGEQMEVIPVKEVIRSAFFGGFLGFFFTNSPCARGKC